MSALYLSNGTDTGQVVRAPRSTDAIGAALRGVFQCPTIPEDMGRLLRQLGKPA